MALEFLFTGQCAMTDAAGRGAEDLIRAGAQEFAVSAAFANGETICRKRSARSHTVELNGNRVPVEAAEAFLKKQFGSTDVLSAVLNAGRFIEMSEAEQKRLLAQVLDAGRVEISSEISEAIRAINPTPPRLRSVADVEAAYKRFYELRTETSRALKTLGHMEKPDIPPDLPNSQEVRKRLDDLRGQKERLVAKKAEADASWQAAQERLKQVQAEIADVSSELLSPTEEQDLVQLETQRDHAEKLRQELTDLIAERKAVEASLGAVEGMKGKCPTCRQPISETMRKEEAEALRGRLADLEGMVQGTREELSEYVGIEAATARLEEHRRALARRAKLLEEESRLRAVQRPNAGDLESRMTILVERINKGERVLEKAQRLESARDRWETYVREKSTLDTRISLLDRLTEFFGPSGAMMGQAGERMGSFAEALNRHLGAFGYTCTIGPEPFEIRVSQSKGVNSALSLTQLSESERFRFSTAFQVALAKATGTRFLVVDRADVLDRARRKLLAGMLVNSDIDQAIVLATGEEPPPLAVPQGVKFVDLTGAKEPAGEKLAGRTPAIPSSRPADALARLAHA
jgi:DNA repair exonuclease SbcCD ATPase subunit